MNKKQKQAYLKHSCHCPYCKSENLSGGSSHFEDNGVVWHDIECHDCKKLWRDVYKLVDVEEIDME